MANQNEEKYQDVIFLRSCLPRPNGIIIGHSYDLIDNEPYIIYFRSLDLFDAYSVMNSEEKRNLMIPYREIACNKKYDEEVKNRSTYDPYFDYKMCKRETSEKLRALLRERKEQSTEYKILNQHYNYLLKQESRTKKVCRHCLSVLSHYEPMGNTYRGYRVCMRCKNQIPHFNINI